MPSMATPCPTTQTNLATLTASSPRTTHYLAFDVFIGGWAVRDAQQRGISQLLVVPALVLKFLLGPAGLLLYLAIRRWAPSSAAAPPSIAASRAPRG